MYKGITDESVVKYASLITPFCTSICDLYEVKIFMVVFVIGVNYSPLE